MTELGPAAWVRVLFAALPLNAPVAAQDIHDRLAAEAVEQQQRCRPGSDDQVTSELFAKFGITGNELVRLAAEIRANGGPSPTTVARYAAGDRAWHLGALAQAAYYDAIPPVDWDADGVADWERVNAYKSPTGFAAAAYRWRHPQSIRMPGLESIRYVVAFRGTDQWRDWVAANLPALVLPIDAQRPRAIRYTRSIVRRYRLKADDVMVVGHSLGGRLAQLVAAATGVRAYTFNAAVPKDLLPVIRLQPPNPRILSVVSSADLVNPATKLLSQSHDLGEVLTFSFCGPGQGHALGGMLDTLARVTRTYREMMVPPSN